MQQARHYLIIVLFPKLQIRICKKKTRLESREILSQNVLDQLRMLSRHFRLLTSRILAQVGQKRSITEHYIYFDTSNAENIIKISLNQRNNGDYRTFKK